MILNAYFHLGRPHLGTITKENRKGFYKESWVILLRILLRYLDTSRVKMTLKRKIRLCPSFYRGVEQSGKSICSGIDSVLEDGVLGVLCERWVAHFYIASPFEVSGNGAMQGNRVLLDLPSLKC